MGLTEWSSIVAKCVSVQNEPARHGVVFFIFGPSFQVRDNEKGGKAFREDRIIDTSKRNSLYFSKKTHFYHEFLRFLRYYLYSCPSLKWPLIGNIRGGVKDIIKGRDYKPL